MARFSLKQLLVFVFACCVYLAVLRSFIVAVVAMSGNLPAVVAMSGNTQPRMFVEIQIVVWLVFLVLYCSWRLNYVRTFHSVTMVVMVHFFLLLALAEFWTGQTVLLNAAFGFALSTLVSFPIAILGISHDRLGQRSPVSTTQTPKPKRRWYHFSSKTLMLYVLVSTVLAGWIGIGERRARENAPDNLIGGTWKVEQDPGSVSSPAVFEFRDDGTFSTYSGEIATNGHQSLTDGSGSYRGGGNTDGFKLFLEDDDELVRFHEVWVIFENVNTLILKGYSRGMVYRLVRQD